MSKDYTVDWRPTSAAAAEYAGALQVSPKTQGTGILNVSMNTTNSLQGAEIIKTLMGEYSYYSVEQNKESSEQILGFITDQVTKYSHTRDSIQENLLDYQQKNNLINVETQTGTYFGEITDADKYLEHPYSHIKANAYDMVLNGNEIGGGSIRIYQRELQEKMFAALGMSKEEAQDKFGFLMGAFEYGAPPHGGIALGMDRLCALLGGQESIRDFIAFPKNNAGRDVMLDAPSGIDEVQKKELGLR